MLSALAQLATEAGLDLGEIAQANLDKLRSRHERAVLRQGRAGLAHLFFPPYTGKARKLARLASRLFE